MRLIIATKNKSKLREIRAILKGVDIQIVCLADLKKHPRIAENGKTFSENAAKKAFAVSKFYPQDYVLGEDSGLEVEYLGGAPGVRSKRYAGSDGNAEKNNAKLLRALAGIPLRQRKASFCCSLALVKNCKLIRIFEGKLPGLISKEARGSNGFGYDPVFYLPAYRKTVAQLPLSRKNKISHRFRAFNKFKKHFLQ